MVTEARGYRPLLEKGSERLRFTPATPSVSQAHTTDYNG